MSSSPTNKSAATAVAACIKEDATSANAHSLSKPEEESPSVSQSNSSESTDPPINVKFQIKALGFSYLKISFIFTTIYYKKVSFLLKVGLWNPVSSFTDKGSFTNYVDKILAFFDHLPPSIDIFYDMNVDKKWKF